MSTQPTRTDDERIEHAQSLNPTATYATRSLVTIDGDTVRIAFAERHVVGDETITRYHTAVVLPISTAAALRELLPKLVDAP